MSEKERDVIIRGVGPTCEVCFMENICPFFDEDDAMNMGDEELDDYKLAACMVATVSTD